MYSQTDARTARRGKRETIRKGNKCSARSGPIWRSCCWQPAFFRHLNAALASQGNQQGIAIAPAYPLIALRALLPAFGVRPLHFDLHQFDLFLRGIASLAHIGGVAATPLLAASYSPSLVPVGILRVLPGYILAPASAC